MTSNKHNMLVLIYNIHISGISLIYKQSICVLDFLNCACDMFHIIIYINSTSIKVTTRCVAMLETCVYKYVNKNIHKYE